MNLAEHTESYEDLVPKFSIDQPCVIAVHHEGDGLLGMSLSPLVSQDLVGMEWLRNLQLYQISSDYSVPQPITSADALLSPIDLVGMEPGQSLENISILNAPHQAVSEMHLRSFALSLSEDGHMTLFSRDMDQFESTLRAILSKKLCLKADQIPTAMLHWLTEPLDDDSWHIASRTEIGQRICITTQRYGSTARTFTAQWLL